MAQSQDPAEFDQWISWLTGAEGPVDDSGEVMQQAVRRWCRRLFDAEGPVTREVATRAFVAHQVALANEAVTAVAADLYRATSYRPTMLVDVLDEHVVRIAINGSFTTPSVRAVELPQALVEVGDYFQEQLDQDVGCWHVCEQHDVGLHAEVHDATAVWWCRLGHHSVARIGEFGATH